MLDEFARYTALQRDQAPLASLLIYLRRKGGYVQLNQIWREMGPTGGGPFCNQTTLINKLDKLERLEIDQVSGFILAALKREAEIVKHITGAMDEHMRYLLSLDGIAKPRIAKNHARFAPARPEILEGHD